MNIIDRYRVEMEMEQKMSPDAKKTSPEYYELLIQVRLLHSKRQHEILSLIFKRLKEGLHSVNKLEELDNGFDIYCRNHSVMNLALSLFRDFIIDEKRSKKLTGVDQLKSKKTYRYTQSISIIDLRKGDEVEIKGEKFTIKAVNKKELILTDEKTGRKEVLSYSIIKDYLRLLN
jgi:NMD protein affecting ribosome stability and mRNA decay